MIPFADDIHYVAIWFVYPPSPKHVAANPLVRPNDMMGALYRCDNGTIFCRYRFAYYDAADKLVEKRCFGFSADAGHSLETLAATCRDVSNLAACRNGSKVDWVEIDGGVARALKLLDEYPWWHSQPATPQELDPLAQQAQRIRIEEAFSIPDEIDRG